MASTSARRRNDERSDESNPTILDEEEQEAILQDFRLANLRSNKYFKMFMTGLIAVLIIVYVLLMVTGWGTSEDVFGDLEAEERGRQATFVLLLTNAASIVGFLASIAYLYRSITQRTWQSTIFLAFFACLPALFWLTRWAVLSKELDSFALLPFLPVLIFLVVAYAVHDMDGSEHAIGQLEQSMYKVKSA